MSEGGDMVALPFTDATTAIDNGRVVAPAVAGVAVHCDRCAWPVASLPKPRTRERAVWVAKHHTSASQRRAGPRNRGNWRHGLYSKYPSDEGVQAAMNDILAMLPQTSDPDLHMVKRAAQLQVLLDPALDALRKVGAYVVDKGDVRARRLFGDVLAGIREERALRAELGITPRGLASLGRDLSEGRAFDAIAEVRRVKGEAAG